MKYLDGRRDTWLRRFHEYACIYFTLLNTNISNFIITGSKLNTEGHPESTDGSVLTF
jgi:hypothetical protein